MSNDFSQFDIAFEDVPFDSKKEERLQKIMTVFQADNYKNNYYLSTRFKNFYEIYIKGESKLPYYDFLRDAIQNYVEHSLAVKNPEVATAYRSIIGYYIYCSIPNCINVADDCIDKFTCFTAAAKQTQTSFLTVTDYRKVEGWVASNQPEQLPDDHNVVLIIRQDGAIHEARRYSAIDNNVVSSSFVEVFYLLYTPPVEKMPNDHE